MLPSKISPNVSITTIVSSNVNTIFIFPKVGKINLKNPLFIREPVYGSELTQFERKCTVKRLFISSGLEPGSFSTVRKRRTTNWAACFLFNQQHYSILNSTMSNFIWCYIQEYTIFYLNFQIITVKTFFYVLMVTKYRSMK